MTTDTAHLIESLRSVIAPGSTHLDVRLSRPDIVALLTQVDGLWTQHGRDSAELRRLCAARDALRADVTRLRGEASVLRDLLREADQVLDHIEPDDTEEANALGELQRQIRSAMQHHVPATYITTQATRCAGCDQNKHTPLRIDAMGGYVCLTCIDKKLGTLLGEFGYPAPQAPMTDEELEALAQEHYDNGNGTFRRLIRAVEAHHGIGSTS